MVLNPPEEFAIVENYVYRCASILSANYIYLNSLKLKCVLVLSLENLTKPALSFLQLNGIRLVNFDVSQNFCNSTKTWKPITDETVKECLESLLDAENLPILIMGRFQLVLVFSVFEVGVIVGCMRKLQDWNYNSIISEYRSFIGDKRRYFNEQFIELFDTDFVTVPANSWL